MIRDRSDSFLKQNPILFLNSRKAFKLLLYFLVLVILFILSCSPTKRFTEKEKKNNKTETKEATSKNEKEKESETEIDFGEIRVSMQGLIPSESLQIESQVYLFNDESKLALVKAGNKINCFGFGGKVNLEINEQIFDGKKFYLASTETEDIIKVSGKRYRGKIQISSL
ncbi:MAG: hypothetical protein OQK56_02950, partial [Ignavibacteriaceae bacterium]|nr:hypothetical protein [Ignavibacteriaceae bacterium]